MKPQQLLRLIFFVAGWAMLSCVAVNKPWNEFFLTLGAGSLLYLGESLADASYHYLRK